MKVFRGNLILTDAASQITSAVIAVKEGKIVEILKGTTEIPPSWNDVTEVRSNIASKIFFFIHEQNYDGRSLTPATDYSCQG